MRVSRDGREMDGWVEVGRDITSILFIYSLHTHNKIKNRGAA